MNVQNPNEIHRWLFPDNSYIQYRSAFNELIECEQGLDDLGEERQILLNYQKYQEWKNRYYNELNAIMAKGEIEK